MQRVPSDPPFHMMSATPIKPNLGDDHDGLEQEAVELVCVLSFNVSEPSGAGGIACDVGTISALGCYPLPVITGVLIRDTAEVFDHHPLEAEVVAEQARSILEDVAVAGWKVGYLGCAESVGAVAEILSDYPEIPLVAYMPNLSWLEDDLQQEYADAFRELILPQAELLVGSHQTLTDFLLPEWEGEQAPTARELAAAAAQCGCSFVLVTSIVVPPTEGTKSGISERGTEQFLENVLASSHGPIASEKFERFETGFIGVGDTLSAAIVTLLATGSELPSSAGEALSFVDQALEAGFQPGMGSWVPDRFFWTELLSEEKSIPSDVIPLGRKKTPHVH
jgi:hydroxymethylpyrimidine/phosphomethylpyrimidine kinase